MPIRAEMKRRYPADWPQIRARILERAGDRCETCGVENGAIGYRDAEGAFHELPGMQAEVAALDGLKTIRIVLTIAHIDPTPENCEPSNLLAECQRCHNRRDAPMRARNAAETRRRKRGVGSFDFEGQPA